MREHRFHSGFFAFEALYRLTAALCVCLLLLSAFLTRGANAENIPLRVTSIASDDGSADHREACG